MKELTYSKAINEALREEMARDSKVLVLGEEVGVPRGGVFGVTQGLEEEFGKSRVRNTPISEMAIAGAAVGASLLGYRPVAEIMYVDFITLAMDQIVNQAAKVRYMFGGKARPSLVIRTQGGVGRGGAAQHSQSLEIWFATIPGLKVAMPATPADAKGMLKAAIRDDNPVIFIEHKKLYATRGMVPEGDHVVPLGKAEVKRQGTAATIVTYSYMVLEALAAAEQLAARGIDVEVVDLRSVNPIDWERVLSSVKKTGKLIAVYEACKTGGLGAEICSRAAEELFDYLDAPVQRVAGLDTPIPYNRKLERAAIPNADQIVAAVDRVL